MRSVPASGRPPSFLKPAVTTGQQSPTRMHPGLVAGYPTAALGFKVAPPAHVLQQRLGALSPPRSGVAPGSPEPVRRQATTPMTPRYVAVDRVVSPSHVASGRGSAVGSSASVPPKQASSNKGSAVAPAVITPMQSRILLTAHSGSGVTASAAGLGGGASTPLPPPPPGSFTWAGPPASVQAVWGTTNAAATSLQPPLAHGIATPRSPRFGGSSVLCTPSRGASPTSNSRLAIAGSTPVSARRL
mmetsp:Transcript_44173/g.131883  ORF Transcript_44173/g.131883 Transcript_44173/m.131883 type:complete len:244 (+) Transcript_44173:1-732(+)